LSKKTNILLLLTLLIPLGACQSTTTTTKSLNPSVGGTITKTSWYGAESGKHTATGEKFNRNGLTAAHRTLPFGTRVHLTNPSNGKSVIVRINDRGPAKWTGRNLDVAQGAARTLGFEGAGTAKLHMKIVGRD
jgi:rare lipoprotein A